MRLARLFTGLQPLRRDHPQPRAEVDLVPFCADHLGGARRGQQQEFEPARGYAIHLSAAARRKPGRGVGQGGEIAARNDLAGLAIELAGLLHLGESFGQ